MIRKKGAKHSLGQDLEVGQVSHVGMVRSENQDYCDFLEPEEEEELVSKGRLLVVCDGMGGHNGGTIASHTAVQQVIESFSHAKSTNQKRLLSAAIDQANAAVRNKGARDPKLRNMGTTCVAMVIRGKRVLVAHVGDSRAYLFRDGRAKQITRDHTYLNDLIDIGLLTPEKAKNHPERNIITRCVGMADVLQIDFNALETRADDMFLLCSDGLYNHVEDEEMIEHAQRLEPQAAAQALVDLANARGGEDNITVAILKVIAVDPAFAEVNDLDPLEDPTPAAGTRVVTVEESTVAMTGDDLADTLEITPSSPAPTTQVSRQALGGGLKIWLIIIVLELVVLIALQLFILGY